MTRKPFSLWTRESLDFPSRAFPSRGGFRGCSSKAGIAGRQLVRRRQRFRLHEGDPRFRSRRGLYRDGDHAHWNAAPFELAVETRDVRSVDTLTIKLAPGGGQAIRFKAL
jgi:hypothetical protein